MEQKSSHQHARTPMEIWAEAASQKSQDLDQLQPCSLRKAASYETVQERVLVLHQRYQSRRSTRWFRKLGPVIEHLRTFSDAIGVFTQSNPDVSCLVWGSLKMVLDAACVFSHTMEMIVDMYEEITRAMPRFQEYMEHFPQRKGLQDALLRIYCAYLDFAVSAVKFFSRSAYVHLLFSFIKSGFLKMTFGNITSQIRQASREFYAEAALAHTISTCGSLAKIQSVLPQTAWRPEPPEKVFSVPWSRSSKFCGRTSELGQLHNFLAPSQSEQQSCVLHGMAGVGKTSTALEFAYRSRDIFPYIFWIPAEDETVLVEAFARLAELLGLAPSSRGLDPALQIEKARAWLCQNTSWLMVFDNAEASELLHRYWPACGHGSILITTQDRKMTHRSRSEVKLFTLTVEEGSYLLLRQLPEKTKSQEAAEKLSRDISKEVGGLPLLLVGLAGHIIDSHASLPQTLQDMQQPWSGNDSIIASLSPESATFQYQRPIHMAFNVSVSRLPAVALSVLQIMSMLSPDSINENLVAVDISDRGLGVLGGQGRSRFLQDVRSPLVARHLVELHEPENAPPFYSLHRQLQWKLLTDLDCDPLARQITFDRTVALIRQIFPPLSEFMIPMISEWDSYQLSIAHVLRLQEVYEVSRSKTPPIAGRLAFAELLTSAGNYLYEANIVGPGLAVLATSAQICRDLGSDIPEDVEFRSNPPLPAGSECSLSELIKLEATALTISWGIISRNQGLTGDRVAMDKIRRALHLREKHAEMPLAENDKFHSCILLSNAYNDMACELIHMHQYEEAEIFLKKSLHLKQELSLERDIPPFEYAESKNNLAYVRIEQGLMKEAVLVSQQAVSLMEKEDGCAIDTRFAFCYGVCLVNASRTEEALVVLKGVHDLRASKFGKSDLNALDSAFAIALALYRLGRYLEANDAMANCFPSQGNVLQSRELFARATYLHSAILHKLGQSNRADELRARAIEELHSLLATISSELLPDSVRDGSDPFVLMNYIVPYTAGRSMTSGLFSN